MAFQISEFTNTGMELLAAASATKTLVIDSIYCLEEQLDENTLIAITPEELQQRSDLIHDYTIKVASVGIDPNSDELSRVVIDLAMQPSATASRVFKTLVVTAHYIEAGQNSAIMTFYGMSDENGMEVPYNASVELTQQIVFTFAFNRDSSITVADSVSNYLLADETKRFMTTHSMQSTLVGDYQVVYGDKYFRDGITVDRRVDEYDELRGGIHLTSNGTQCASILTKDIYNPDVNGLIFASEIDHTLARNEKVFVFTTTSGQISNDIEIRASWDDPTKLELRAPILNCSKLYCETTLDLYPSEDDTYVLGGDGQRWSSIGVYQLDTKSILNEWTSEFYGDMKAVLHGNGGAYQIDVTTGGESTTSYIFTANAFACDVEVNCRSLHTTSTALVDGNLTVRSNAIISGDARVGSLSAIQDADGSVYSMHYFTRKYVSGNTYEGYLNLKPASTTDADSVLPGDIVEIAINQAFIDRYGEGGVIKMNKRIFINYSDDTNRYRALTLQALTTSYNQCELYESSMEIPDGAYVTKNHVDSFTGSQYRENGIRVLKLMKL